MAKYIRTPAYYDRMPIDISFVFEDEKPAGKHGFCKAEGDQLRFEDGTLARFWGVNINGSAIFPEHDYAEKFANRIAQTGCNLVRFHQLDAEWANSNIFAFRRGKRVTSTRQFDPESMERMDYLVYCLKERGIYVYLDMMTYRKFKSEDGVPFVEELNDSAKPYSTTNKRLIELQKEFCTQIWSHVNPYTGLAYKDDPVFVLTEITNECDLFVSKCDVKEGEKGYYYSKEVREMLRDWLAENNIDFDWENCDMNVQTSPVVDFKIDITRRYYREMYEHMRSIGVKIPIAGTNWSIRPGLIPSQQDMDFTDTHIYYRKDWDWGEEEQSCGNVRINGQQSIMDMQATMRLNNKPLFISEWDMQWPNNYRAEAPIYYAAMSALQDWSGMAIHTYSYGTDLDKMDVMGREVSSTGISNVAYRAGIFSTWNDPAKYGLFYHSALIVRRCDVTPANKKIGVRQLSLQDLINDAWKTGLEKHRLTTIVDGMSMEGCDEVIPADKAFEWEVIPAKYRYPWEKDHIVRSDNGQMWRNLEQKYAAIDTPRTKVIYGRLCRLEDGHPAPLDETEVDGMKVEGRTDFGVVALSSLTDDPIETSGNMLLTTIGRARNTDAQFDGEKMIEIGHAPILSEVIRATITIRTNRTDLQVWGINAEGYYVGKMNPVFENGHMTFTVGDRWPASYYLIVAE